jgi:antitoxin HicB
MGAEEVEQYLRLPYTIEIQRDETPGFQGWFASVRELPGCMTQAETFVELGSMIEDAMRAWIEVALEDGREIPRPGVATSFSGKFLLRMPRSLHQKLAQAAEREEVSLNQYCNVALAYYLGRSSGESPRDAGAETPETLYRATGRTRKVAERRSAGSDPS